MKMMNKNIIYLLVLITLTTTVFPQTQQVVINEFLASNSSVNIDPDFNSYSDWIELYNPTNATVDLSNWFLTDDFTNPSKWQIPNGLSISPLGFLGFWADGKDTIQQNLHTNFKLSSSGEQIGLFNSDTVLVDSISFGNQTTDISFGRKPDGSQDWFLFDSPTPGAANSTSIFSQLEAPQFSLPSSFYKDEQVLDILTNSRSVVIHYTTNGDEPTTSSPIYSASIPIQSRVGDANVFSQIKTNSDPYSWLPNWIPPAGEVFKANVIRARAFKTGSTPSKITTGTYFVDKNISERYSTLPVISLVSDYKHLFNDTTGIYVPGIHHRSGSNGSGNYFENWEKPAHIEFFDVDRTLGFSQDVGITVQGGTSPASPQKGLHIIARSEYGNKRIDYPIFQTDPSKAKKLTKFKRFILRSWGSLIGGALLNDAFAHRIMSKSDLDIQGYQPVVVFINGEYWGLHSLREANKNSWYYQHHYDIDRDNPGYDILRHTSRNGFPFAYAEEGDANNWNKMMLFINTNDMSLTENYEILKTKIDMNNFITYLGHCMFIGKWDWPNNNDASWKPRTEDAKWRWIQYDMETGFGAATVLGPQFTMLGPQLDMVKVITEGVNIPGFGKYGPHPIVAKVYKNQEFQDSLKSWFDYHLTHEFNPDTLNILLDEMAAEIRPYIEEYKHRAPYIGTMYNGWQNAIDEIKDFNIARPDFMRSHLLGLTDVDENESIVESFYLSQNYPNPFNPSTTIKYSIPSLETPLSRGVGSVLVTLKIYDLLGKKITTLVNEEKPSGNYSVQWDATKHSGGLYFYTINVGGFRETKKMILLK